MPAEHWVHLKTTNPIESTFATVGLRTKVTKGPGSRAAGLAMAHKLTRTAESPGARWWRARRALRGGGGVSPVRDDELLGLRHRLLALGASLAVRVQGHGLVAGVVGIAANYQDLPTLDVPHSYGVYGVDDNFDTDQASDPTYGMYGTSTEGTGVYGATAADGQPGVHGVDASTTGGIGVQGSSTAGIGVSGTSNTGIAVAASITNAISSATAVSATTIGTGPAILATNASGTALEVAGIASFSRSGLATVAGTSSAPKSSVTVTGVPLTASSLILSTPQGKVAGVSIEGVVVDTATSSFTISLTKAVKVSLAIAWFIVG